ncbi:alpha/beta-hydrolase family protein [Ornithinicoccus hortensis]|uniref:Putative membrane protein n=1 Tax=Ornithinicoccus hortensis TaxID=82346 RepID=A0A542YS42_9MICO|nr:alpha/beta-hydrolase family protein [Ornithinicoccus hortensis]TQL50916.1 putative membrane protein [Ornithinicoccus hortensis]
MFSRRPHALLLSLLAALTATVLTLVATPAVAGAERTPAGRAVLALASGTGTEALAAVPADFADVMGYHPVLEAGELVRADGDCSSPVPLPPAFEPACRQHDYGYDLLRYAGATGAPLGTWARTSVDGLLRDRLDRLCAGTSSVGSCGPNAQMAATAVELNSLRQGQGVPDESLVTGAALASSALGLLGMTAVVLPDRVVRRLAGGARRLSGGARRLLSRVRRLAGLVRVSPPTVGATVLVTGAVLLSLVPSLLPRPVLVQGPLTGVLVALALLAAWLVGRVRRCVTGGLAHAQLHPHPDPRPGTTRGRWLALSVGVAVVLAGVVCAGLLLADQAGTVGLAAPAPTHWPVVAALAGGTASGLVLLGRGAAWAVTRVRALRVGVRLTALGIGGAVSLAAAPAGGGLLDLLDKDLDPGHVMLQESPVGAGRTYVTYDEESDPEAAAALAADRLVADGGLEREAVVVIVPTGSGWVNQHAVAAFEAQFGAGVATVAVQYDESPSWLSMLTARSTSESSAHAVVAAVADRLSTVPEDQRPALYVAGESLGSLAGQAALADPALADRTCGALWSGVPGGGSLGLAGERSLANADDPVVHLTPGTATSRPEDWGGQVWLPGISYGTTVLDLATSLAPEAGHGHRYGPEQDWTLPTCDAR